MSRFAQNHFLFHKKQQLRFTGRNVTAKYSDVGFREFGSSTFSRDMIWHGAQLKCLLQTEMCSTWIGNHIRYKVWYGITYPFINFNDEVVKVWTKYFHSTHCWACDYLFVPKLNQCILVKGASARLHYQPAWALKCTPDTNIPTNHNRCFNPPTAVLR